VRRIWILLSAVVGLWGMGGLLLWAVQGAHNRLPSEVDARYPPGQPFAPGEVFASTLAILMTHELEDGFGWRPNDFFLWGPALWADDNANRQLAILSVVRASMQVLKEHLTKGDREGYDPDLLEADALFRADARNFWFPSAESQFSQGVGKIQQYVTGLHESSPRSRPLVMSESKLVPLLQVWIDLLEEAHGNLYKTREADGGSTWWRVDDYFYHAQGYAHGIHALLWALRREYAQLLGMRPVVQALFDEASAALREAALMNPLVILAGSPSGVFANHCRNLDTYMTEARQKMYAIRDELDK
jgi:hypothetical protein